MQFPPEIDWNALVTGVGTGVGGFGVLRLVEGLAKLLVGRLRDKDEHADKKEAREADERRQADLAETAIRNELRTQISTLYARCDVLTDRLDTAYLRHVELVRDIADLKAENHKILARNELIRAENHQMRSYMTTLIVRTQHYHKLLGLPPEDMPLVPTWLADLKRPAAVADEPHVETPT